MCTLSIFVGVAQHRMRTIMNFPFFENFQILFSAISVHFFFWKYLMIIKFHLMFLNWLKTKYYKIYNISVAYYTIFQFQMIWYPKKHLVSYIYIYIINSSLANVHFGAMVRDDRPAPYGDVSPGSNPGETFFFLLLPYIQNLLQY